MKCEARGETFGFPSVNEQLIQTIEAQDRMVEDLEEMNHTLINLLAQYMSVEEFERQLEEIQG